MTVEFTTGDIWESGAQAIVIPVNCRGVMGAGLALQAKQRYPVLNSKYRNACEAGKFHPGDAWVYSDGGQLFILAATKDHWKDRSLLRWVRQTIEGVHICCGYSQVKSVAIPPLGCGLGGLKWSRVRPLMEQEFSEDHRFRTLIYEPI